ncbi:hypothetical protein PsYK624_150890 [Phanerochaete sordida]|uniref:Uncharacterized protein n=1 Tax=Phanerochaete sordida TaxID=48140 RepID=A0A9P3GNN7_9APHY|nr:hypothetical protein PsYK624_150890 [Phanerochaete sordida]
MRDKCELPSGAPCPAAMYPGWPCRHVHLAPRGVCRDRAIGAPASSPEGKPSGYFSTIKMQKCRPERAARADMRRNQPRHLNRVRSGMKMIQVECRRPYRTDVRILVL